MVEIDYQPIKKVVILEVIPLDTPEDLATVLAPIQATGQPVILSWANGVVFFPAPLPPSTDKLMDEYTGGTIYWSNVQYSLMPEYKPIITITPKTGGTVEIGVIDVSANSTMIKIASWLKEFRKS